MLGVVPVLVQPAVSIAPTLVPTEYSYLVRPETLELIPLQFADSVVKDPVLNDISTPVPLPSKTVPPVGAVVSIPKSRAVSAFTSQKI
jgi:hypothetical protein